ncbi:MAG: energy transducer TonB [Putridiphycobacter sp.]
MKILFTILLFGFSLFGIGQSEIDTSVTYDLVEEFPQFVGGDSELMKFLFDNISFPEGADKNLSGTYVYVEFIVMRDGSLDDIKIVKGSNLLLNNEAIRVIKLMPNWNPGKINNVLVNTRVTLPIKFELN